MEIFFPDWADLGLGHVSAQTRWSWDYQLGILEQYRRYFDGEIFEEKIPDEAHTGEDQPLMYPVAVNLVKMLTIALSDAMFGEWIEQPIYFGVRKDEERTSADEQAIELLGQILENSNAGAMFWEHELVRNTFGGGVLRIAPNHTYPGHIRWHHVPRQGFFPVWDPDDPDELLEAYVLTTMSTEQAKAKYGYDGPGEYVNRVEYWTKSTYTTYVDRNVIKTYSGANPWGFVPFVYTPRIRLTNWFGDALTKDIIGPQDELNSRLADIGDALEYNAHPTRWGINLPSNFNAENYPLGANSFWDLGRKIGNNPPPEVGILQAEHAVRPEAFEHIRFMYDWARTSSFAPPIAFGEDNGGGQRSGITLEIRMWPLLKAVRRSRAYLRTSLTKAMRMSALMLRQKSYPDVPVRALSSIIDGRITPHFFNIMPRDQAALVDEVVKLLSTDPPGISLETSQILLGRGIGEVNRIRKMLKEFHEWQMQKQKDLQEIAPEQPPKQPAQKPEPKSKEAA